MLFPMAFEQQIAVFDITGWDGLNFSVPAELNPSGYDIVDLEIEFLDAVNDTSKTSILADSSVWSSIGGSNLPPFITGTFDNAVAAIASGNRGTVTTGGGYRTAVGALFPAPDVRVVATLQAASGGAQGKR